MKESISIEYEVFENSDQLSASDKSLLEEARNVTAKAYAPYSNFRVGAVAQLSDGRVVSGTNQENASFPVGICAERSLLATAAMMFEAIPITTMAIAYHNLRGKSNKPVSPCGMCRQAIHEYEERTKTPMRIILSGMEGAVYIIEKASQLLPLSFDGSELK